jgi:RHS repeat-associated protein
MNAIHPSTSLSTGLGNVLTTISDRKKRLPGTTPAFEAVIETAQDYYPFGSLMPGRKYNAGEYRFGFNGQEKDDEIAGVTGSHLDFGARIYDSRLGRWLSLDPLMNKYPSLNPYNFVANMPTIAIDPDGNEIWIVTSRDNKGEVNGMVKYSNGKLYNENGSLYEGNNLFASKIQNTINNLNKVDDKFVREVTKTIENSNLRHFIEEDPYGGDRVTSLNYIKSDNGEPVGSHIIVTLDNSKIENNLESNEEITLGHEFRHAFDYDQGLSDGGAFTIPSNKSKQEIRAVNFENRIRKYLKMDLRTSYGKKPIDEKYLEDVEKPHDKENELKGGGNIGS